MDGWYGSMTLSAGDTVYFDSSDTWTLSGGSQGLWIEGGVTYDGDTWGGGTRAKFDVTKTYPQSRAAVLLVEDHPILETVFKGFEVDVNMMESRGIAINNGYRAGLSSDGATKRIENCYVHHIGDSSYNYGIHVSGTTSVTVKNVEIIDCIVHDTPRSAICLYAGYTSDNCNIYNVTIRGCEVYRAHLNPSSLGAGILCKNHVEDILIEKNSIYDNNNNITIERTYSGALPPKNITIRYNLIASGTSNGIYIQRHSSSDVYIYGNIIYENEKSGIKFESNLSGTLSYYIFNNTFYSNWDTEIKIQRSEATFKDLEIKNNIFHSASDKQYLSESTGGRITDHSNNLFYREGGSGGLVDIGGKVYYSSNIKDWESSAETGLSNFKNAAGNDFSLAQGSHAINKGANMSYIFKEGLDAKSVWPGGVKSLEWGNDRWEIGAFVYDETTPRVDLAAPKNFRVVH
jgi:hypothetical protein